MLKFQQVESSKMIEAIRKERFMKEKAMMASHRRIAIKG